MTTATPPLGRRVVLVGVLVVAFVLLAVNTGVYVALRASLLGSLDELLDERAQTVRIDARTVTPGDAGAQQLTRDLQARGLRVLVRAPDGTVYRSEPSSSTLGGGLPPAPGDEAFVSREVGLTGGGSARVFASTSGIAQTLQRLLALQVLGSLVALVAAAMLLSRASRIALRPVTRIVEASVRTTAGQRGERLRPDRPDTELGRLAAAYDEMLDALEAGLKVAAKLERRSGTFETRWRQVLEAAQEAYVAVDASGLIVDGNRRTEELFGWSREELVGQPATELVPERHRPGVVRGLAEEVGRETALVGVPYELEARTRTGQVFPAECTVWGIDRRGGVVVHLFVRDVTERRRSEEASARLAAVVEGSADAILTQDLDGTIRTWNCAAERSYGWPVAEAVGQPMSLIVPEETMAAQTEMLATIGSGRPVAGYEGERLTRGGIRVPVSVRLAPVHDAHGTVVAVSSIARDVTEQRWMAETLDQSLVALQAAAEEARNSEEATRRFLADAAHQLRTPMAGIRACAETLLRGAGPEDTDRLLATMVRETSRAARLISALLKIARLDQGLSSPVGPVDLVRLCADEVERLSLLSPDLEVELDVRAAPDGPVLLDAGGCQEILSNLGDNARRHAAARIRLVVDRGASGVRVVVADDGPGMPVDEVEQVFARFVSLDGRGGSGLGLPIARSLARSMGGELGYDEGFVLELPAQATLGAAETATSGTAI
jgi:PAS domain S-box-containing protein